MKPFTRKHAEAETEALTHEVAVGTHGALVRAVDLELVVGDRVGAVHVHEVREVDVVLGHLLTAGRHVELDDLVRRPFGIEQLRDFGNVVEGLAVLAVVPRPDHVVAFDARIGADARLRRHALHVAVGDLVALAAGAVVAPPVERAPDAPVFDASADADVRTEVRAVRVDHVRRAVGAAEQHHVGAEHLERAVLAGDEVTRLGDDEPAVRDREREARFARLAAHDRPATPIDERLRIARHREAGERFVLVTWSTCMRLRTFRRARARVPAERRRALLRWSGRSVRRAAPTRRDPRRTPRPR